MRKLGHLRKTTALRRAQARRNRPQMATLAATMTATLMWSWVARKKARNPKRSQNQRQHPNPKLLRSPKHPKNQPSPRKLLQSMFLHPTSGIVLLLKLFLSQFIALIVKKNFLCRWQEIKVKLKVKKLMNGTFVFSETYRNICVTFFDVYHKHLCITY